MPRNSDHSGGLHDYESEAVPSDDRLRRLLMLRQAIESGAYNDEAIWGELLGNLKQRLPGGGDDAEEDS